MENLCDFLNFFDKASKCLQIPFPKPKIESGSTKSKNNLFARYYNDIIEHSKIQLLYRSDLKTTIPVSFLSKSLNYPAINLFLQKLSILNIVNFSTFTRKVITLQTGAEQLSANVVCGTFTPDCWYNTNSIKLMGNVRCSNEICSGILCVLKKIFRSLSRSNYQCPHCTSTRQLRNISNEEQLSSLSWSVTDGFLFLKRYINQFKTLLEMCNVQHAWRKSVYKFQQLNNFFFTTARSAKAVLTCLIFHLQTENWSTVLFDGDSTHCFAKRRVATTKKKSTPLMKNFLRQSQLATTELVLNGKK